MRAAIVIMLSAWLTVASCSSHPKAGEAQQDFGSVVGRLIPGGLHGPGVYTGGLIRVRDQRGHEIATQAVTATTAFHFRLPAGTYNLVAAYLDEPAKRGPV